MINLSTKPVEEMLNAILTNAEITYFSSISFWQQPAILSWMLTEIMTFLSCGVLKLPNLCLDTSYEIAIKENNHLFLQFKTIQYSCYLDATTNYL